MKNKPWETPEGSVIWKTEAQYWNWLRGAMRRIWSDYPLRKEWKRTQLRPVTQVERDNKKFHPSTKNVGECHYCNEFFPGSRLEVDHETPSDGCRSKEQAEAFLFYCGNGIGDDFRLACKPCHKIKTLSERNNITFEEAIVQKEAIEIINTLKTAKKLDGYIESNGGVVCKNAVERRIEIENIIRNRIETEGK